ncbi:odorant receptor 67d-like [Aedes albopictus]|uniref:Odorant receptor n=1 Tax=Aedes albopictus TaxID=7160 RepID=A0ABM1Z0U9_AEDAL
MFDENRLTLLSSQDLFDEMINFLRVFLTFCGSDVLLMDKFRWNARTWLCFWTLVSFAITLFYTIVFRSDDIYAIMDTLSYSGIAIQGAFKMHGALSRVTLFQQKYMGLKALYARFSKEPDNNMALNKCVLTITYIFRFFLLIYAAGGLAFFVIPLYVLFVYQKVVLILHVEIPFVDPDVFSGYVITTAYQVMMIALAIAGILAADMGIMILVLHIVGIVDIFRNKLKELDRMLEDAQYSKQQIHEKVSEICVMHREIIKYEEDLDECYHTTVFVQVLTSVACLSLALFVVYMTNDWTRAMFLAATFFQLLEFCLLGTALTLKNDQAIVAIYHTKWYLLTPSDQKRLMFVLHRSQNAVEMTIGGVALLNMETFVAIMKTIYSYFTMLLTFISNE